MKKYHGTYDVLTGIISINLAVLCLGSHDLTNARVSQEISYDVFRKFLGENHHFSKATNKFLQCNNWLWLLIFYIFWKWIRDKINFQAANKTEQKESKAHFIIFALWEPVQTWNEICIFCLLSSYYLKHVIFS